MDQDILRAPGPVVTGFRAPGKDASPQVLSGPALKLRVSHPDEPCVMGVTATDGSHLTVLHDLKGLLIAPKGKGVPVVDGFDSVKRDIVKDIHGPRELGLLSRVKMERVGQDGDAALLVDELNGTFGGQTGWNEVLQEKTDDMAVQGTDLFADNDLYSQVGALEGIFQGAEGTVQGVMISDGDKRKAGLRGDFNDLAGGVKPVRKIGVKV